MSSYKAPVVDGEDPNNKDLNADPKSGEQPTQASKESIEKQKVQEKAEQRERIYQGMVNKEFLKVTNAITSGEDREEAISNISNDLREEVVSRLDKLSPVKQETSSSSDAADEVEQRIELKQILKLVDEDSVDDVRDDYQVYRRAGKSHDEAIAKVRKHYKVPTDEEVQGFGQRARQVTNTQFSRPSDVVKPQTSKEKNFSKVIDRFVQQNGGKKS